MLVNSNRHLTVIATQIIYSLHANAMIMINSVFNGRRGILYQEQKRYDEAIQSYKSAIHYRPRMASKYPFKSTMVIEINWTNRWICCVIHHPYQWPIWIWGWCTPWSVRKRRPSRCTDAALSWTVPVWRTRAPTRRRKYRLFSTWAASTPTTPTTWPPLTSTTKPFNECLRTTNLRYTIQHERVSSFNTGVMLKGWGGEGEHHAEMDN